MEESLLHTYLSAVYEDGQNISSANEAGTNDSTVALRHVGRYYSLQNDPGKRELMTEESLQKLDLTKPQEVYVVGSVQDQKAVRSSLPGIERIGVDFDFDVHDYNWGSTNAGFGSTAQ